MWPGLLCARLPCPGCAQKLNSVPLWGVCLCTWMGWTRYGVLVLFLFIYFLKKLSGTVCGHDNDADGWADVDLGCSHFKCKQDNCVGKPNSGQEDSDLDGVGDDCDEDADGDGILNTEDNCPLHVNVDQADTDRDGVGDACDNCMRIKNRYQENVDGDKFGDKCDRDIDNDEIPNKKDNCPFHENKDQADVDNDGVGDICDNCKEVFNPNQDDYNHNLIGDACDEGGSNKHF